MVEFCQVELAQFSWILNIKAIGYKYLSVVVHDIIDSGNGDDEIVITKVIGAVGVLVVVRMGYRVVVVVVVIVV